jgi:3-methyladenine DNA glycosylase/8-oxoguanine DNA glycosylase
MPAADRVAIPTPKGFVFETTVESHGWYLLAPNRWSRPEQTLRRAERVSGKVVDLAIRHRGRALIIEGAADSPDLRVRMNRMFQLGLDVGDFHARARDSADHAWVVEAGFGRLLCGATLWEDAVKIIATTNTTWKQTMRMVELLVEKCGRSSPQGYAAFPEPKDIVRFDVGTLQEECRLGYRAKTMHALAQGIVDRTIDLKLLSAPTKSTHELFKSYRELPGIGPYGSAHLLAMDGRHDFIAVDTEFRRHVRERYHKGRKVSDAAMLRRYAKWGRWKYLAYWSELWKGVGVSLQEMQRAEDK